MTIYDLLEGEYVSINARHCIVRSLDDQCNPTVWFDGDVSDGSEITDAGYDDDGSTRPWYDGFSILWIQTEGDVLAIEVDGEVE